MTQQEKDSYRPIQKKKFRYLCVQNLRDVKAALPYLQYISLISLQNKQHFSF